MPDIFAERRRDTEDHWVSITDMMSGLMIIFMFIAVAYMIHVSAARDNIRRIAITYERLQRDLYAELHAEFSDSLASWRARINPERLSVEFYAPEILFLQNSSQVRPRFRAILSAFFPRFVGIVTSPKYRDDIAEIRIEGHTSSEWNNRDTGEVAYFRNMELSQDRTRSVLRFVMGIPGVLPQRAWLRSRLTANGLSSSRPVLDPEGRENVEACRRVEFRIKTEAEKRIVRIVDESTNETR